ncbi:MAG: type I DNA topoisomerase [Lachnospiraceae bacterium]|nr:type I DNA topoisomerase [Lachnospiraceae bacterium]
MAKKLIIVESPAKVKTIKKFLGDSYIVTASGGHVRDLPKSEMGINIEGDFEPKYITIRGKGSTLSDLKKQAKEADKVYLATDPDREGEAISWHLKEAMGLDESKACRISFNEITKTAVQAAIKAPRSIDMNLVDAQPARRVLDRVVGYSISPLLWRKVKKGLSAGRVQSATLAMIAAREAEIAAFIPEEYWTIDAELTADGNKKPVVFHLAEKERPHDQAGADALVRELTPAVWKIGDIKVTPKSRKAPLPFTTSSLQQDASRYLNMSPQRTMRVAQQLYEGINIKGSGTVALITYLRTDSTRIADEAQAAARDYIVGTYGAEYAAGTAAKAKSGANVQDAHEAIRPTDVTRTPESIKDSLDRDQLRLYQLIWKRFVASRMTDMKTEVTTVKAAAAGHSFIATATVITFKGYRQVYNLGDEKAEKDGALEKLTMDSALELVRLIPEQHFTQPPAHYTESTLVHAMEECGIGRPSTYAPTITLLQSRHYIAKEQKNLYITELGSAVNGIMVDHFPDIADTGFTAEMESRLDKVADGKTGWKDLMHSFYPGFETELRKADSALGKVKLADEVSDVVCDKCGRMMVYKMGKYGRFLACPGFPECRNIKSIVVDAGFSCPECGSRMTVRKTKAGKKYFSCSNYPACKYMTWDKPKK